MGTVGNLWINIKANTNGLDKGINKSKKSLGGFKGALAGLGAAVVAGFAVKAVKDFANAIGDAMGRIDEIAKFSKSIGVATESVQVFRHAAELTGVTVGEADKAFGKMVKNVGETSMGIGTATDAFKVLGLNAQELSNMNADQMFGVIADSIMQVDNRAQQASLAYDIFGRAGMKLLNTMEMGSEGMKEMREEMEGLGVLFSSLDAEGVERANDAMTTLGTVIDSIFQQVAIQLAPAIEDLAAQLTAMASDPAFRDAVDEMTETIKGFAESIIDLKDKHAGEVFRDIAFFIGGGMLGIQKKTTDTTARLAEWREEMKEMGVLTMHQAELNNKAAKLAEEAKRIAEETKIREEAEAFKKELTAIDGLITTFSEKNRLFNINKEMEELEANYERINNAVINGNVATEEGLFALREMRKIYAELSDEKESIFNPEIVDETTQKFQEMGEALTKSMRTPMEELTDGIKEIEELLAGGFITKETSERAIQNLQDTLIDKPLQLNLGIVEGLQSALGTIKVGGEVSKVEQLAQESVAQEEKMVTFLNSIDAGQGELIKSIEAPQEVDAGSLGDAISKGVSSVEIKVSGLNSLDIMKDTLDNIHSVSADQFTESKEQTVLLRKIADGGSGGALK